MPATTPIPTEEVAVSITLAQAEADVRTFAAQYPTPNVLRGIELAEAGRISWHSLYDLSRSALRAAIADRDERAAATASR